VEWPSTGCAPLCHFLEEIHIIPVPNSVPHLDWNWCDSIAIRLPAERGKCPYSIVVSAHHLVLSDIVEIARAITHMQGVPGSSPGASTKEIPLGIKHLLRGPDQ
jgi:hypothetical protein